MYGIDAGVARIEPREQRAGRARERDADARLQDAVAFGDAADRGIEGRPVERVRDDADQLARGVARQPRVAVERDAVAHLRQDRQVADVHGEAGVGGAAQQAVELLDLAALALPSHPQPFAARSTGAVRWKRKKRSAPSVGVLRVERGDAGARGRQDLGVVRQRLGRRRRGSRSGWRSGCADRGCRAPGPRDARSDRRRARRCRASSARSPSSAPTPGTRSSSSRGSRRGGIR